MSTAQQLGLIGNSVKVQSLPTASAETFGAGNRFYTLIGQQEGYITGHTYRTVVANDVYSWEDVAGGNYNMLDNIPVINQDLSASGFTPVTNTYYRHTGATTSTFTQGVIYYYDGTEYKALDGSGGGGMTLNRYTYSIGEQASENALRRVRRIVTGSKIAPRARLILSSDWQWHEIVNVSDYGYWVFTRCYEKCDSTNIVETDYIWMYRSDSYTAFEKRQKIDTGEITTQKNEYAYGTHKLEIVYYNDVEIT